MFSLLYIVLMVCLIQMEVQQYHSMSEITVSGRNVPKPIIHFPEAAFPGNFCVLQR